MHNSIEHGQPFYRRDTNDALYVDAAVFHMLTPQMQREVQATLEHDAERRARDAAQVLKPVESHVSVAETRLRDPLDSVADTLGDIAAGLVRMATLEQTLVDARHQVANLLADSARMIRNRTARIWE